MVHQRTLAAGALLLAVVLSACGSGGSSSTTHGASAPTDASSATFCKGFLDIDTDVDPGKVADDLTKVGTPSAISSVARKGFEVLVDHVRDLPDNPNNSDLTALVKGLQASDRAAVLAFWKFYGDECEPEPSAPAS
jgi:hypothetical protein